MRASAPGKVLIVGGYLIVQSPNVGISIGVNARFTTHVVSFSSSVSPNITTIHIFSPQFNQNFTFTCVTDKNVVTAKQSEGPTSHFLYYAALFGVAAARLLGSDAGQELHLELLADNDFYSQRNYLETHNETVNVSNLRQLPKNLPLVGKVSKTGLGSSAAMTTSIIACLCSHFHQSNNVKLELIHRVAQIAHSVAQGKIGSGFDVFTAVYGTCVYRRFPVRSVEALVKSVEWPEMVSVSELSQCIALETEWVPYEPFHLPQGLKLVLGDVHFGGTSTPGMVGKVMTWLKSVSDMPSNLWEKLRENNKAYVQQLRALSMQSSTCSMEHQVALSVLQCVRMAEYKPTNEAEERIISAFKLAAANRLYLREMGIAAGVKIEPEEMTELLNDTASLPGVFAVGCPGAGGYDAVFALVIGDANCSVVEQFWESYTKLNVCPLLVREDCGGLLIETV
ncbi:unnamed protein product [Phytomonas sp. Hart1]|nr:unnamed protein product [Phytomonas sp. Hart1]|eukprot:CCW67816.1 unnamed protein product [Phytomonas sp. isolate Hart1]